MSLCSGHDALINLVDWCKRERATLQQRLELMKAGKFRIGEKEVGREWVDTTPQAIDQVERSIGELDKVLADYEARSPR
jgi:hypothetical protein